MRRWRDEDAAESLLVVLTGQAGVGKTSLALRWLHEVREEFPDGQLFVDLGAATASGPLGPGEVLEWFLTSLGVEARKVPVEQERREALFRTLTSARRLAVVLDNAVSAAQVRPLCPGGRQSITVVTSRLRLSGLVVDGARWLDVRSLDAHDSVELLRATLGGERVVAELDAANELADLCGGLPLALSVVGARLSTRPRRTLQHEVADLRVTRRRLPALSLDGVSVEAVLTASYDGLTAPARTLYRAGSVHPGREFGVEVMAAAVDWPVGRTEEVLEVLVAANLLAEVDDGRFAYHDLLRLHAQLCGDAEDLPGERAARLHRMISWYLDRSVCADLVIHLLRQRVGPRYAIVSRECVFADAEDALGWLEAERVNIRQALRAAWDAGWHDLVWQLCESQWGFFLHTRHYGDWVEMHRLGIDSTQRCGNRQAEARLRSQLGFAYAKLNRYEEAAEQSQRVLDLAVGDGDHQAQASALSALGRAARGMGETAAALEYFRQSLEIQRQLQRWRGVALCQRRIGDLLSLQGRHDDAIAELRAAAATMNELGDTTQHARALMFLGMAQARAGRSDEAHPPLTAALALMRDLGSTYYQAEITACLAAIAEESDDRESARCYYDQASRLYAAVEDLRADVMRSRLAALTPSDCSGDGPPTVHR